MSCKGRRHPFEQDTLVHNYFPLKCEPGIPKCGIEVGAPFEDNQNESECDEGEEIEANLAQQGPPIESEALCGQNLRRFFDTWLSVVQSREESHASHCAFSFILVIIIHMMICSA